MRRLCHKAPKKHHTLPADVLPNASEALFIVESRLEGYAVTIIKFLTIFYTFGFFGLLGYFVPRLYRLLILRFFWVKISKSVEIQSFDCLRRFYDRKTPPNPALTTSGLG